MKGELRGRSVSDMTSRLESRKRGLGPAGPGAKSDLTSRPGRRSSMSCQRPGGNSLSGSRIAQSSVGTTTGCDGYLDVEASDTAVVSVWTWDEVVKTHWTSVFRTAYGLTNNRPDAEDLTQDVFLTVFRCLSTYTAAAFEHRLRRTAITLHRTQSRRNQDLAAVKIVGKAGKLCESPRSSAEAIAEDGGLSLDVLSALADLEPELRDAIMLTDVGAHSCMEVARFLGIERDMVRDRVQRARIELRLALAHRAPRLTQLIAIVGAGKCSS